ncbi:MAG: permease prefix domain 1-containing protein [Acidimicrobiia bacterium]|nr:permease prefix domain 1-containing protein [Acidimicrobiia bacterium]
MANYALIDSYLGTVRARAHRRDVGEVLAELEDHLYTTVEVLIGDGMDPGLAERRTLERFGDVDVMADSFASQPRGGPVMPTRFTKTSGTLAIAGGVLWIVYVGLWWAAGVSPPWGEVEWESLSAASGILYMMGAGCLLAAAFLTFVTVLALNRRHGGLGRPGRIGLVLCGLAVIGALAAWIFVGWGSLLMVGMILTAIPVLQRGIGPRLPTLALGLGIPAGAITAVVFRALEDKLSLGWIGLWGDQWIPDLTGITVAAVILAVGLIGLGTWLRGEGLVDTDIAEHPLSAQ